MSSILIEYLPVSRRETRCTKIVFFILDFDPSLALNCSVYVKTRLLLFFLALVVFTVLWILTGISDNHILSLSIHDTLFLIYTAFAGPSLIPGCQAGMHLFTELESTRGNFSPLLKHLFCSPSLKFISTFFSPFLCFSLSLWGRGVEREEGIVLKVCLEKRKPE